LHEDYCHRHLAVLLNCEGVRQRSHSYINF
jgi:hypothetical protein